MEKYLRFPSGSYGGSEGGGEEEKIFRHYEPFVNTLNWQA